MGYKFRRQHGVSEYILDFYCPELRLAIEVDGATHEDDETRRNDEQRQKKIEQRGIRFLRFRDEDVLGSMDTVLERIQREIGQVE